jgi:D-serine deaminase-like pyridoxal phosphate-dependent protein
MSSPQKAYKHSAETLFGRLSNILSAHACAQPTLLIDQRAFDKNITQLQQVLASGFHYRLVVKSLPCIALIQYVLAKTDSQRLMCFHLPFLKKMVDTFPDSDILLGKPMTDQGLESTLVWLKQKQASAHSIQWLVDSEARLRSYDEIAQKQQLKIKINLEIDIGLGRGGFKDTSSFERALAFIKNSEHLCFSGLMGGPKAAVKKAQATYAKFKNIALTYFNSDDLCFNSGGSTTITHYQAANKSATKKSSEHSAANELSLGSALMKPCDFDLPSLRAFEPALYIASPVLKVLDAPSLPGPPFLTKACKALSLLPQKAACIYGGNWLAQAVYPERFERIKLFGHSSNQEMYALPEDSTLRANDWVYFRPSQSEALMLQFGDIAFIDADDKLTWWPSLDANSPL